VDWTVVGGTFSKKEKKKSTLVSDYTLGVNWIIIFHASRLKIQLFKKKLPKIMGGVVANT
jgi:cytoskeletal protein RodZ